MLALPARIGTVDDPNMTTTQLFPGGIWAVLMRDVNSVPKKNSVKQVFFQKATLAKVSFCLSARFAQASGGLRIVIRPYCEKAEGRKLIKT